MYTSHGHQIPGTMVDEERPKSVARCGGPRLCSICSREAASALRPNDSVNDAEVRLWQKFERITGSNVQERGLSDVLHILTGPELFPLLLDYICTLEFDQRTETIAAYAVKRLKGESLDAP